jgi:hypothetical protein
VVYQGGKCNPAATSATVQKLAIRRAVCFVIYVKEWRVVGKKRLSPYDDGALAAIA